MIGKRPAAVAQHQTSHALHEDPIFLGYLLGPPHKYTAGAVHDVGLGAPRDQAHDGVLQELTVARLLFVPDHQIDRQSFESPIGVGLDDLPHQFHLVAIRDSQQDDGQIAGDAVAPQTGLAAHVFGQDAGGGAALAARINNRAGQPGVVLGFGLRGVELLQDHLPVRPR